MSERRHIPVLLEETLRYLGSEREGLYIDCTIGMAGHASEILKRNLKAKLIGFDLDEQSLQQAKDILLPYAGRVELYHSDFRYLAELGIDLSEVRGILIDLGISSFQLDSPERGFSHSLDGPLDMRMDVRNKMTAAKILDKYSEPKLAQIFHEYGELKQSNKLAKAIASIRRSKRIESTTHLRGIVEDVCRWRPQSGKIHPAAKVFQALRIELNQELQGLAGFLEQTARLVPPNARIVAISFHSLEDRIVKHTFVRLARPDAGQGILEVLTKKPVTAAAEEIARNSRSRSAKLRAAEKISHGSQEIH